MKKEIRMPDTEKLCIIIIMPICFERPKEAIKYLKQLLEIDNQNHLVYFSLGFSYMTLCQYDNAIPEFEKALEIYNKWGSKPTWILNYTNLGYAYHKTGQYKKEKKLYKKAEQDFPDDPDLIFRQAILSLTEGDTVRQIDILRNIYLSCKDKFSDLKQ